MCYDVDIISFELVLTDTSKSIDDIRDDMYLDWEMNEMEMDNGVGPLENYFHWDDEFINDLVKLVQIGVEGEIVIMDEEGEYTKYVLTDNEVKEFDGIIVYEEHLHNRFTEVK